MPLGRLTAALGGFFARLRALSPRSRLLLTVACALSLLAVTLTFLLGTAPRSAPPIAFVPSAAATATLTSAPTLTANPTATHGKPTPTHPPNVVVHVPPPPPVPTPPPNPVSQFCPTPTPLPIPTATSTAVPTATGSPAPTATNSPMPDPSAQAMPALALSCVQCPYYKGNNPSQSQIRAALTAAASAYHLPVNLLFADAWQESKWHEDVTSCDGGVGLMQIQYYLASYFNGLAYGACGISATNYDPYTLQGNANLGAKVFAYLECYYTFGGPYGGTASAPANGSSAYNYVTSSPPLSYPDITYLNGTANPNSYCRAVYNDPNNPEYPALPMNASQPWSCPYSAQPNDATLLDIVLSAYNAGQGAIYQCGCIPNPWYGASVEGFIPQFASGALPVAS
ncbi:MAG: transglycosylase SLT domain-containing protein [Ktedonobacterales bacterium]